MLPLKGSSAFNDLQKITKKGHYLNISWLVTQRTVLAQVLN